MYTILTQENFSKEVLESTQPVLVELNADWCGACHIIAPVLEKLAVEFNGQIKFGRLDVDANEQTARTYGLYELPTLLFFKNGRLVDSVIGVTARTTLQTRITKLLHADE